MNTQPIKQSVDLTPLPQQYQPTFHQPYLGLEYRLRHTLSTTWCTALQSQLCDNHVVITIGGDQATGKSTLAKNLARLYHADYISAGTLFRELATTQDMNVSQFSKFALNNITIDCTIDYNLMKYCCRGSSDNNNSNAALILEGRNPSVMGNYIKYKYQKNNIICIYLQCSIIQQALRYIEREAPESLDVIRNELYTHDTTKFTSLSDICSIIQSMNSLPNQSIIVDRFKSNVNRDNDDRLRYELLYGKHELLDYRNKKLYDIIIDTTDNHSNDTYQQTIQQLHKLGIDPPYSNTSKL